MTLVIRKINKVIENTGLKILVHALAGAGKTVLCATGGGPTIILSAESGLLSIAGAPEYIHVAVINTLTDLEDAYQYLKSEEENPKYEWVAIDSITEIAERILANEKQQSTDPRKAYGNLVDEINSIMKKFRDLKNYDIVMACKQQRIKEEGSPSYFAPMLPGNKAWQEIPYLFDEVFALRVEVDENKETYRVLQTGRDGKYEAKDRSGALDLFEEPNLKKIKKKIKAHIANMQEQSKASSKKTKITAEIIDEIISEKEETTPVVVEDQNQDVEEVAASEDLYWVHHESSSCGIITKGELFNKEKYENNDVIFINKDEYTKLIEVENYSF